MRAVIDRLRGYYECNPARSLSLLAAVVVFVAAKAGLVIPEATVAQALSLMLPIIVGGQLIHDRVTPAPKPLTFLPHIRTFVGDAPAVDADEIARRVAAALNAETTTEPGTPPAPVAGSMGT